MTRPCSPFPPGLVAMLVVMAGSPVGAEILPDPTRPPGPRSSAPSLRPEPTPAWTLSMVKFDADRPLAIVNGALVRPGDRLGDAIVMEISPRQVVLERAGKRIELTLTATRVKAPAEDRQP